MNSKVVVAALVLTLASPALADSASPQSVGDAFCAAMVAGFDDPLDLLTPTLSEAVDLALARNAQLQAATPDEKPPLGDGVPWSSWPDKPDTCAVSLVDERSIYTRVVIDYGFDEAPDANYSDVLIVSPYRPDIGQPVQWRVDDVEMLDGMTLRMALDQAFSD